MVNLINQRDLIHTLNTQNEKWHLIKFKSCRSGLTSILMIRDHLNIQDFYLVGHDRGGRVAHRMALDYPQRIKKLMVLDIAPTLWMYEHTDMMFVSLGDNNDIRSRLMGYRQRGIGIGSSSFSLRPIQ
jgi:pimeloyl-ACP methyl ester carboxylesterase